MTGIVTFTDEQLEVIRIGGARSGRSRWLARVAIAGRRLEPWMEGRGRPFPDALYEEIQEGGEGRG